MKKKVTRIIINILFTLFLIIFYFMIQTKTSISVNSDKISLAEDWTVSVNGTYYEALCLKDIFFPVTNTSDHVELTTTLPDIDMSRPSLQFKIYHAVITVYVDGEEIYCYGKESNAIGEMVGSGYHWVSLPEDFAGKELKICFDVTEDNAFSSVEVISIMEEHNITKNFILENITEIVIGIFLLSFGILLGLVVLFLGRKDKEYRILFWIAIFSIAVAAWMLSSFGILQLAFRNLHVIAYFEFLSLYLAPIPLLLFVCDILDNDKTMHVIYIFSGIIALFDIIVIILNEQNIYHFSEVLPIFHMLGLCTVALITFANISALKHQNKKSDRIILLGLGIMVVFLFADTLRFNVDKYLHPKTVDLSSSILPIGVLIFVMTMIASYIFKLVQIFYENVEKQTLVQIAYTDALTHIGNRAMCEKTFHEWETAKKEATIINFDLNHFKEVNDTFGHSVGDKLLVEFAEILQDNYKKMGVVGRMGGDEFIVMLNTTDSSYVEKTIADLMKKIDDLNKKKDRPYQISVAYGYYSNYENPDCSLWEIYQNSDKKMYQNKTANR